MLHVTHYLTTQLITLVDYLQALSDENKINVEKIGSVNWYWSFASEDKKTRQKVLSDARSARVKSVSVVNDLKQRLAEAQAQREDEEDMPDGGSEIREKLMVGKADLEAEVRVLQRQLAAYSDTDPTELECKKEEIEHSKNEAEQYTDDIYSMEAWYKKMGEDEEGMKVLRMTLYGDEVDKEDTILKELM